ncbi:HvfC family RiPP maturation protein [Psychrobacter lutiphocae]|uniref:HvfC family RiPP maturation protein n=1 Tax=Psychrobacter lutiphocae TaxID=540500 RepID=UPI0003787B98|nr:DUF2063 domain-containing protein [Psychrobacter lutiphocae]
MTLSKVNSAGADTSAASKVAATSLTGISLTGTSLTATSPLAEFQQSFGQYLREQKSHIDKSNSDSASPYLTNETLTNVTLANGASIPSRIGNLYQTLVFNNIRGFLDKCFPVCQSLISDDKWLYICKQFFLNYPCHSPYFTEINKHFVEYLSEPKVLQLLELPPYFAELAHYEWVELMVDTYILDPLPSIAPTVDIEQPLNESASDVSDMSLSDCGLSYLSINPSVQNLHYQWPVHLISAEFQPNSPEDSFYLVYRDYQNKVQFMTVNALTYALIDFISSHLSSYVNNYNPIEATDSGLTKLMQAFANHLGYEDEQILVSFGIPLIHQLLDQQVLFTS